jgi:hypothetical protein
VIRNPEENRLPNGLDQERVLDAVRRSGYPLQSVVAAELQGGFVVTEEWGYPDRATQEHRTLDIFAYRELIGESRGGLDINPSLALLVECKQSRLPYVFFKSVTQDGRATVDFPTIARVAHPTIHADASSRMVSPAVCLGFSTLKFNHDGPPVCASFARVRGRGGDPSNAERDDGKHEGPHPKVKGIELSGSEGYENILLPLISAMEHLADYPKSARPLWPMIALSICVLDAPMILSEGGPEAPILSLVPWVRVARQEKRKRLNDIVLHRFVVDFVHRRALRHFLGEVEQMAAEVRRRLIAKCDVLSQGSGSVASLNAWSWNEVTPRPGS